MEEKQGASTAVAPATPTSIGVTSGTTISKHLDGASAEPVHSRRRASGQKRKAGNSSALGSSLGTNKRITRERPPLPLPTNHAAPCTRARQMPSNLLEIPIVRDPSATLSDESNGHPLIPAVVEGSIGEEIAADESSNRKNEAWHALEGQLDAEFEAIRSRDSNAHVVPIHCGWFSWTKVHLLEERMLPSFFSSKVEGRTADTYLDMRNWIVKRYRANPCKFVELEDLSEISAGDLASRKEVKEFLEYWGLINFNPITGTDSDPDPDLDHRGAGEKKRERLNSLYRFEEIDTCLLSPKASAAAPPVLPGGLFTVSEESSTRSGGPAVEYHCNSCSADCSRKRYHCQKQADFDLCTDCFNNGKLDSGMASSDFILMEPAAEVPGGNWSDQETLLLLEALELYKENWNEIAEHVATKTKTQCMLHFIQMPILDSFLSDEAETVSPAANGVVPSSSDKMREALESAGGLPSDGVVASFSEAGNPVMALVSFLAKLVDPAFVAASLHCSMKSLPSKSPAGHLAAHHCFLLPHPPPDTVPAAAAPLSDSENNSKLENDKSELKDGADDVCGPGEREAVTAADEDPAGEKMKCEAPQLKAVESEEAEGGGDDDLRRAAADAIAATALKAKLLAREEECEIRRLVASLVEKQLVKMEMKMSFFGELEKVVSGVRRQLERCRQRLYHERAHIIASRLALQSPSSSATARPPPTPPPHLLLESGKREHN